MFKIFHNRRLFSSLSVPIVDIQPFLNGSGKNVQDCQKVASALHKYGCLIIKDPRVDAETNSKFLDLFQKFFNKRSKQFYAGRTVPDIFPEHHFQVGATPEHTQQAKDHREVIKTFTKENQPVTTSPPPFDAKWRYLWNIGDVMQYIVPNKIPEDFPEFEQIAEKWGNHMIDGCRTVAMMAAIGMGLDQNTFVQMIKRAPHKLAPTGSDLVRFKPGTVFAGFHYDFNFLTIHGKARYPGLFAWLRNGQKFSVSVPEGHLLLQAGKQFEWVTGGYINCGYHEVIYTSQLEKKKEEAIKEGKIPWRISSTLFCTFRGDVILEPLPKFKTPEAQAKYKPISVSQHAFQELEAINLKQS